MMKEKQFTSQNTTALRTLALNSINELIREIQCESEKKLIEDELFKSLLSKKEKLLESYNQMLQEYKKLADDLCTQKGYHEWTFEKKLQSTTPLGYARDGSPIENTVTYRTCCICGLSTDPEKELIDILPYQPGSIKHISAATNVTNEATRNVANRILSIREELPKVLKQAEELTVKLENHTRVLQGSCVHEFRSIDDFFSLSQCKRCGVVHKF